MPLIICLLALLFAAPLAAQYQLPSAPLAQLIDQPDSMGVRLSPDNQWFAALIRSDKPGIATLAQAKLPLAGLSLSQQYHGLSQYKRQYQRVELQRLSAEKVLDKQQINPLFGGDFISVSFSPNSRYLSLIEKTDNDLFLLLHDIHKGKTKRLSKRPLNGVLGLLNLWSKDSQHIMTKLVAGPRPEMNTQASAAVPVVHTTNGQKSAQRTYQHLLSTPSEADMFAGLATSELVKISLRGHISTLEKAAMIDSASLSPDGKLLLISRLQRPFSYLVRYRDFAKTTSVLSLDSGKVTTIVNLPLAETKSDDDDKVRHGYRIIDWRKDLPQTLYLVKAQKKTNKKAQHRDVISQWAAPFDGQPALLLSLKWRFSDINWFSDEFALVSEKRFSQRMVRTWQFAPGQPKNPTLWHKRAFRDQYNAPGKPLKQRNRYGEWVLYRDANNNLLLNSKGASPQGEHPFLKRGQTVNTSQLLWQSKAPFHERIVRLLDPVKLTAVTARQSVDSPVNYYLSDLRANKHLPLTDIRAIEGDFAGIKKQLVSYLRADGVPLSGTLYLPKDHQPGDKPLPVLMWAYPREFKDPKVAGQVSYSPYRYRSVSLRGPLPFLAQGFAIFDKVAMPIIGFDKQKPNNHFRQQLIANAEAAIKVLVDMGVADSKRIAIGGHSYGAFMVGNLLAHSDLFAAGIARSGAYNRSLTPFGFQSEKRDFWQAQQVYSDMSPFFHADKINEPLLMIHGLADANSGTYPMQSTRLFNAIKGLGGQAKLVLLPYEGHSYKARESLLHMLSEQELWLLRYVKG